MTNIFKDKENTGSSFCLFLLNMLICAFSAPKSKASTLFHSDQTIKTLQRVTS